MAPDKTADGLRDYCNEMSEWLSLVSLGSPRILQGDSIDPYLSRFEVPQAAGEEEEVDLAVVDWQGFIPAKWITRLLLACM